jgi:hypothetical protein
MLAAQQSVRAGAGSIGIHSDSPQAIYKPDRSLHDA